VLTIAFLFLASLISWFISSLSGGGSSLLLMPMIGLALGATAIPPVTTVGATLGNVWRALDYRKTIRWEVIGWELPGAALGAALGAFTLSRIQAQWLGVFIALFLIVSAIGSLTQNNEAELMEEELMEAELMEADPKTVVSLGSSPAENRRSIEAWYFLPAGFFYAWMSGIVGSIGPMLTPFYFHYGLVKEELLGTQAASRAVIHIVKLVAYSFYGILTLETLRYGVTIGIAAFFGNWLGRLALERISDRQFRKIALTFVIFSGTLMLWQQRQFLGL
jgi:uncharacterized membrane protein YfcA